MTRYDRQELVLGFLPEWNERPIRAADKIPRKCNLTSVQVSETLSQLREKGLAINLLHTGEPGRNGTYWRKTAPITSQIETPKIETSTSSDGDLIARLERIEQMVSDLHHALTN